MDELEPEASPEVGKGSSDMPEGSGRVLEGSADVVVEVSVDVALLRDSEDGLAVSAEEDAVGSAKLKAEDSMGTEVILDRTSAVELLASDRTVDEEAGSVVTGAA